jgi:hypothetical protein
MYIIQEIQTNGNNTALLPAITKTDKNEMESTVHSILASAAISTVQVHAVVVYDEHGNQVVHKYYEHIPEAQA